MPEIGNFWQKTSIFGDLGISYNSAGISGVFAKNGPKMGYFWRAIFKGAQVFAHFCACLYENRTFLFSQRHAHVCTIFGKMGTFSAIFKPGAHFHKLYQG